MDCLKCALAKARRENAALKGAAVGALPPGWCEAHGPEYQALVRELASARLVNAARKGQAAAEDLREAQGKLYRALRVHASRGEGEARVTAEGAYAKAYGSAPRVVMPLRDPSSRGCVGYSKSPTYVLPARKGEVLAAVEGQGKSWMHAALTAETWADKAERLEATLSPELAARAVDKLALTPPEGQARARPSLGGISTEKLRYRQATHVHSLSPAGVCRSCGWKA